MFFHYDTSMTLYKGEMADTGHGTHRQEIDGDDRESYSTVTRKVVFKNSL
jgi:hypothetical protein